MTFFEEKNVFLTGATGFVGSWLTDYLVKNGANVFCIVKDSRKSTNFHYLGLQNKVKKIIIGDIADFNLIKKIFSKNEIDMCFHIAAQALVETGISSPLPTFEANIKGTWNVFEACRVSESVEGVIVASTDKVYGDAKEFPTPEDAPLNANYPYDASKLATDILSRTYFATYSLPVGIIRCGNIYGGGDLNFSRIFPSTIRSVVFNKNPEMTTDGTPIRDFIHISDTITAYIAVTENLQRNNVKGEAFNFSGGQPIRIIDLVNKIIKISGKKLRPKFLGIRSQDMEIKKLVLSSEKAKRVLSWKPKVDLDSGIRETLWWYDTFFKSEFYKKNK